MIKVYRDLSQLPVFKNAVITIGTFDGVHTGHQQIIQLLKQEAAKTGGESVIITFYPHPRKVIEQGRGEVKMLNTLAEKIDLLNKHDIENLVVIPFDEIFAQQSAEEYVEHFLVEKFHPKTIIIGYDHKFGNGRSGDYHLLENLGEQFSYAVKEIPVHILNEIAVSSTQIRNALMQSDVSTANRLLGYPYFFEGTVTTGNKLGRTIGYPTANLLVDEEEKLVPGNGVYAVNASIDGFKKILSGMMNIGLRPTVDGTSQTIEVNLFDFAQDIYRSKMTVKIAAHLRSEIKFEGLPQLKEQLAKDEAAAREILRKTTDD